MSFQINRKGQTSKLAGIIRAPDFISAAFLGRELEDSSLGAPSPSGGHGVAMAAIMPGVLTEI